MPQKRRSVKGDLDAGRSPQLQERPQERPQEAVRGRRFGVGLLRFGAVAGSGSRARKVLQGLARPLGQGIDLAQGPAHGKGFPPQSAGGLFATGGVIRVANALGIVFQAPC